MEPFRITSDGPLVRVEIHGEFSLEFTDMLKRQLEPWLDSKSCQAVAIDLSETTFMDSSGIGFLVAKASRLRSEGKAFYLLKPSPKVRRILSLVKLERFFTSLDNDEELDKLLPH
ncbi:STAS domain-containing protein [Oceanidesulfovibrio marinus]|uniref:Anti-sigma factor antagonist n=1 Tax=Oceanidesulfovibrio marinus TaxID=370038 RepID=A0A6P1ZQF7_9BACT|nr:STAS domain-containing protein [Oceanidesulfovibrio marinus]QJT08839.1 STAS domain-containing protein [Oceanidesulfovibrio marinus]TVM36735.1 anti-sigma factor antagonist [Oceanidesulfovibrio marinus]